MKTKKYKIKVAVYESTVHLVLSEDVQRTYNTYAKKNSWEQEEENFLGCFIKQDTNTYYMFLPFGVIDQTIVHECAHGTFQILEDHGVIISSDSEESFTYLLDYLFQQVQSKL